MKKRIVAILSMVSMLTLVISPDTAAKMKAADNKKDTEEYIVKVDDTQQYNDYSKEWNKENKRVVNHKEQDEKYLNKVQSAAVELSKDEVKDYQEDDSLTVEKNYQLQASSTEEEPRAIAVEAKDPDEGKSEYTNDPKKYVPLEEKEPEDTDKEIVPWNIACVAGNVKENQYRGEGVKVAVIDSGIDTHYELDTKDWMDFSDKTQGYKPTDNTGHGTEVAGVIGARINGTGMVGIASKAQLYSVKVLDKENQTTISTVIKAIEWCIENDMDIINMSFGTDHYSKVLEEEIEKAHNKGIVMVSAAGNDTKEIQYPAAYDHVISVGSINEKMEVSDFSTKEQTDLVAPGEKVQSTGYVGSHTISSGTSLAAAHVTGVAAAIKSANPQMKGEKLQQVLLTSATKLSDGNKLVNYEAALSGMDGEVQKESVAKVKKVMEAVQEENFEDKVTGSWNNDKWLDQSESSGHYSIINNMDISCFSWGASNDTQKINNRTLVAGSANLTDCIPSLSASGEGNAERDANGEIVYSKGKYSQVNPSYSPYHGKSEYGIIPVVQHLSFLYELARRRLVRNSPLDMTATNYKGAKYYSVPITLEMKRRIIVDMKTLYGRLTSHYKGTGVNVTSTTGQGYMVLGVMLHLVQDIQAHRAIVPWHMVFSSSDKTTEGYKSDVMGLLSSNSKISYTNIAGSGNNKGKPAMLGAAIKKYDGIPFIRLKDFLPSKVTVTCGSGSKTYENCEPAEAYEDNPYFFRKRYFSAVNFSKNYINDLINDKAADSTRDPYKYYVDPDVSIFQGTMSKLQTK